MQQELINSIEDKIFNLSVRMLGNFDDAEDATQDILIKVFTKFHLLNDQDKFIPWAMQIARNHLINRKKEDARFKYLSFEIMEQDCNQLMIPKNESSLSTDEQNILLAELKISCSQAMLMCLSKEERIIYVLSSMFDINSSLGAEIMEITPDAFRQKLSRTKSKLRNFLQNNCGLINKSATCKCRNRLDYALENHRISKDEQLFCSTKYLAKPFDVNTFTETMEHFDDFSDLFKTNPAYALPQNRKTILSKLVEIDNSAFF